MTSAHVLTLASTLLTWNLALGSSLTREPPRRLWVCIHWACWLRRARFRMMWIWKIVQFSNLEIVTKPKQLAGLICWTPPLAQFLSMSLGMKPTRHLHWWEARPYGSLGPCWPTRTTCSFTSVRNPRQLGMLSRSTLMLQHMFPLIWLRRPHPCLHFIHGLQNKFMVMRRQLNQIRRWDQKRLKPTFSCCQEFQMRSNGKTDLATWLKGFNFCVIKFVMGTPVQPCAEDDPRVRRFPCFSHHKRKERQNQFAIWSTCLACGLRITYRPKKDSHGEDRHMGPHPHLIKMAMDQIEASMPKDQVSEKVVNGMLMELKGLQLQHGVSNTMAVNMTYAQYMKRMGFKEESNKKPRSPWQRPATSRRKAWSDAVRGDGCPVLRMGICGDVSPCIGVGDGGGRRQEEKRSI